MEAMLDTVNEAEIKSRKKIIIKFGVIEEVYQKECYRKLASFDTFLFYR